MRIIFAGILAALLSLSGSAVAQAQVRQEAAPKTLTLGVVFQGSREAVQNHFQPLAAYVAHKLAPAGETAAMVVIAPNAGQMMKLLEERRIDFYMESAYPTYLINRLGAAKLLLRRRKGGIGEYHSLIFAAKGSGVSSFADLRGKIIAFEDPGSTSGYFLPKLVLLKKGFFVAPKSRATDPVASNEIGYIFGETANNVVDLVLQQKTAAGAISNDDYAGLEQKSRAAIAVLGQSEPLPRHLVSVRKDLPEPVTKRLKEILLNMHQDDEGQRILRATDDTTRFDTLPGGEEMIRRKLVELYRPRYGK